MTKTDYVRLLEEAKISVKLNHWNTESLSEHKLLDRVHDTISKFEDSFVEDMIMNGNLVLFEDICPRRSLGDSSLALLLEIRAKTFILLERLSDDINIGIKSITEAFVHDLNVLIYLLKKVRRYS